MSGTVCSDEKKEDTAGQKQYLDFLRNLLKDKKICGVVLYDGNFANQKIWFTFCIKYVF